MRGRRWPGHHDVYMQWSGSSIYSDNAPVDIVHAGGTSTVLVTQRQSVEPAGELRLCRRFLGARHDSHGWHHRLCDGGCGAIRAH